LPSILKNGTKIEAELAANISEEEGYNCRSAVLMEAQTGKILYSQDPDAAYSPASVTKIMTLLLVAEALEAKAFTLEDTVTVSDYAASMGGSQVFLKEGERISVEELVKCTVIASANDAAVALCELVSGSEEAFVRKMNAKAMELGMASSNFENVTGLDDTTANHVQSARDIAIASRELIKHDVITKYSSIWQDSIRNGEFTLTNTNRLVRFYEGCNGLKTGSTDKAGYCISVTAKRGGMQLIAVVMGAETRDERNAIARELLDFGFSAYSLLSIEEELIGSLEIPRGKVRFADMYSAPVRTVVEKGDLAGIEKKVSCPETVSAPVAKNTAIGKVEYILNGETVATADIYFKDDIEEISLLSLYLDILGCIFKAK
jgi:D-alanyl-D-alanine carboxypeptidase (penicillin-binding protein 5/6)